MNLTESHFKILESLVGIKKHNSIKHNMRQVLQIHKFAKEDVEHLISQKLIRFTMLGEFQITDAGEKEYKIRAQ